MKLLAVISIALVLTVSVYMIHRTMLSTDKKFKIQENQPFDYDLANTLTSYVVSSYCNQEDLANWQCGETCDKHPEMTDIRVMYNDTRNALGYLAYNTELNAIVAVFRGTIPWSLQNWLDDINTQDVIYKACGLRCTVHKGFYYTFKNVRAQFNDFFFEKLAKYPDAQIIITGHSLGGAMAYHAAAYLAAMNKFTMTLYTYGSPRVGDDDFVSWFLANFKGTHYRITNDHDPVPHVPPKEFGFKHLPVEVYFGSNHTEVQSICRNMLEDPRCSNRHIADLNVGDHISYLGYPMGNQIVQCQNKSKNAVPEQPKEKLFLPF